MLIFKAVDKYSVSDGLLEFSNPVDGAIKRFSVSNAEIEEEGLR